MVLVPCRALLRDGIADWIVPVPAAPTTTCNRCLRTTTSKHVYGSLTALVSIAFAMTVCVLIPSMVRQANMLPGSTVEELVRDQRSLVRQLALNASRSSEAHHTSSWNGGGIKIRQADHDERVAGSLRPLQYAALLVPAEAAGLSNITGFGQNIPKDILKTDGVVTLFAFWEENDPSEADSSHGRPLIHNSISSAQANLEALLKVQWEDSLAMRVASFGQHDGSPPRFLTSVPISPRGR